MSSKDLEFGRQLLLSLPPMEAKEFAVAKSDLTKLNAFQEDFLKEIDTRSCSGDVGGEDDTQLMALVRTKLTDYYQKYSDKDLTARFTLHKSDQEEGSMVLRSYVEQLELSNNRTGSWATEWKIKPGKETEVDISGVAQIHIHYYENGSNVQLRATRHFEVQQAMTAEEAVNSIVARMEAKTMSYEVKVVKAIGKQITAREKELYEQMKEMCDQIDANLKKMRRILPITKTRFKWDAAAQKQVKLLNERKDA
jgi:hypothetical protein